MAAQNEENQSNAVKRFSDDEDNQLKFPSHFGTHYILQLIFIFI